MNADMVLDWLKREAASADLKRFDRFRSANLQEIISEIHYGHSESPRVPANINRNTPRAAFGRVRRSKAFAGKLAAASAVLSRTFPEDFLFWRAPYYDSELLDGLTFLSAAEPRLNFPFNRFGSGLRALDRWKQVGDELLDLAQSWWPRRTHLGGVLKARRDPFECQFRLWHFLYRGVIPLQVQRSLGRRAWLVVGKPVDYGELERDDVEWSGRLEMAPGDRVFMYRMVESKALTDVYEVVGTPWIEPLDAWRACRVKLKRADDSLHLRFADMKADPVLGQWGQVKRHFQGTTAEAIPPRFSARLELLIRGGGDGDQHDEPAPEIDRRWNRRAGDFIDEFDFCTGFIESLLKTWRVRYEREHPCLIRAGCQKIQCRADYVVADQERRVLTVIEAKHSIASNEQLQEAREQGRCYALHLESPSFVIAAPEGCWVHETYSSHMRPVLHLHGDEILARSTEMLEELLQLQHARPGAAGPA